MADLPKKFARRPINPAVEAAVRQAEQRAGIERGEKKKVEEKPKEVVKEEKKSPRKIEQPKEPPKKEERKIPPRLPHGAKFEMMYDAAEEEWSGSLTVTVGGAGERVFRQKRKSLFMLCSSLDFLYRECEKKSEKANDPGV